MKKPQKVFGGFDSKLIIEALLLSVTKLNPKMQWKNPVMLVVWLGSVFCSVDTLYGWFVGDSAAFGAMLSVWLWATVLFANFAESLAEGRGQAQAATLRATRSGTLAKQLMGPDRNSMYNNVDAGMLRKGDYVLVEAGDIIPTDGDAVAGVATVDESAITGESAPVIRESGGDRSAVTGGTRVLSDWIVIQVVANPGETFLDRMIGMVEGANRKKTPNEIALSILLVSLTVVFLAVTASLLPLSQYVSQRMGVAQAVPVHFLVALLVCLIPTTIGALLSCIGIAGMGRLLDARVIATSGRAVEAAGDVDVLLLDKTGTITHGNRFAADFIPMPGVARKRLAEASFFASLADDTPEGRSILALVRKELPTIYPKEEHLSTPIAFSAHTRMSGMDTLRSDGSKIMLRKGSIGAIRSWCESLQGNVPEYLITESDRISSKGSTPLAVAENEVILGVVELKDVVKDGIQERFAELRRMGIRTVMVTGDNPRTAAAIAAEAGVDDYVAEATPEAKLARIRAEQAKGLLVAMTGDGTNDAPALAQADVALAMNSGTQAAKEAGNMIDLDSDPTKLIEIVAIGKQMLMTRGALTTFSIANDISKYFAILPALFVGVIPQLACLNVMGLHSPESAILSAVIFNALIIVGLVPLAIRGVPFRAESAMVLLRRNLLIYGVGGFIAPFLGIKVIDMLITLTGVL